MAFNTLKTWCFLPIAAVLIFLRPPVVMAFDSGCVAFCDDGGGSDDGGGYDGGGYDGGGYDGGGTYYDPGPSEYEIRQMQANALNDQGLAADKRGDYHEAIRLYKEALALDPSNAIIKRNLTFPLNKLGNLAYEEKDFATAVNYYREAVANDPSDKVLQSNLENAEDELRWQQQQAEEKRQMEAAKGRIGGMLDDFAGEITSSGGADQGLDMMALDEAIPLTPMPESGAAIAKSKERVGLRLMEIEDKLLDAPPGQSAWEGGYGGTLDSPEAAGVKKPAPPPPPVHAGGGPLYETATAPSRESFTPNLSAVPDVGPAGPVGGEAAIGAEPVDVEQSAGVLGAEVTAEEVKEKTDAALSISDLYAGKKQYDKALQYLDAALQQSPDDPDILKERERIQSLMEGGEDLKDAPAQIAKATPAPAKSQTPKAAPQQAAPPPVRAEPKFSKGTKDSAPVDLSALEGDKPPTIHPDRVKKLPPPKKDSRKTEVLLDALQAGKGNWDISVAYLQGQLAANPNDKAVRDTLHYVRGMRRGYLQAKNTGDEFYKQGVRKWLDEDYISSAKAFAQAVRQNPDDLPAVKTYGFTLGLAMESLHCNVASGCRWVDYPDRIKLNDEELEKLEAFKQEVAKNPEDLRARAAHNYIEGLATYESFLESSAEKKLNPPDPETLRLMSNGVTKLSQRDYPGAVKDFAQAYQANVGDKGILFSLEYTRGRDAMRRGNFAEVTEAPPDPRMQEVSKEMQAGLSQLLAGKTVKDATVDMDAASLQKMLAKDSDANPFVGALSESEVVKITSDPFFSGPAR